MEVTSVEMERKGSFAHLEPSETYIKAFYKLRELEVALVSACLTADQVPQQLCEFWRTTGGREEGGGSFFVAPLFVQNVSGISTVGEMGGAISNRTSKSGYILVLFSDLISLPSLSPTISPAKASKTVGELPERRSDSGGGCHSLLSQGTRSL